MIGPDKEKHPISFGDFIAEPAKQRLSCQILRYSRTAKGHTQADGLHLVASDDFAMQQRIHGNVYSNSFTNDVTDRITKRIAKSEYSTIKVECMVALHSDIGVAPQLNGNDSNYACTSATDAQPATACGM
jgi:hypothetical protein